MTSPTETSEAAAPTHSDPDKPTPRPVPLNCSVVSAELHGRMLAGLTFVLLVLGAGLPLWWHTTKTYRAALPYALIEELWETNLQIGMELKFVCTDAACQKIVRDARVQLLDALRRKTTVDGTLSFDFSITESPLANSCDVPKTNTSDWLSGSLHVFAMGADCAEPGTTPRLDSHGVLIVSALNVNDLVAQTSDGIGRLVVDVDALALIGERHSRSRRSEQSAAVQNDAAATVEDADRRRRHIWEAAAKPSTHLDFYVVVPDPAKFDRSDGGGKLGNSLLRHMDPFLDYVRPLTNLTVSVQYLYDVQLAGDKLSSGDCKFVIDQRSAPHVITPTEKYTVSMEPRADVYRFLLYLVPSDRTPTCFVDDKNEPLPGNAISVASWGGVVLVNGLHGEMDWTPDDHVLAALIDQVATTLGLNAHNADDNSWPYQVRRAALHSSVDNALAARAALVSLVDLLSNITNIVITEEVAAEVSAAAASLQEASSLMSQRQLHAALRHSQSASAAARHATDDETLLALLYFPDDQKYAIYIPLGLPVCVPVVLSMAPVLGYFWRLWKGGKVKRE